MTINFSVLPSRSSFVSSQPSTLASDDTPEPFARWRPVLAAVSDCPSSDQILVGQPLARNARHEAIEPVQGMPLHVALVEAERELVNDDAASSRDRKARGARPILRARLLYYRQANHAMNYPLPQPIGKIIAMQPSVPRGQRLAFAPRLRPFAPRRRARVHPPRVRLRDLPCGSRYGPVPVPVAATSWIPAGIVPEPGGADDRGRSGIAQLLRRVLDRTRPVAVHAAMFRGGGV